MLVGEPPYTGSTPQAVLGKIITAEAPAVREQRRAVPRHVEAAIHRALEKLPADRFRSAEELTDALGDSGFRHGFALDMPEGIRTPFQGGLNIDISPDGSTVAFVGQAGDRGGRLQIYLRPLDELLPSAVAGTENALEPRFSPDGASLAFVEDRGIVTLPLSGGPTSLVVSDLVRLEVGGFTWGPDGSIYFSGADGGLWRSSRGRAEPERVTTPSSDGEVHLWPDVLPGARALLFTRQIGSVDQSEIAVASTETGEVRTLFPGAIARYAQSGHLVYTSGIAESRGCTLRSRDAGDHGTRPNDSRGRPCGRGPREQLLRRFDHRSASLPDGRLTRGGGNDAPFG
jgi:serine/threonine-protein kinase